MPELAEVERARRLLEQIAVGHRIERVQCDSDRIVFDGVAPRTVQRHLRGRDVLKAHRHGKYLWLELDQRPWPVFHLGMTGHWISPTTSSIELQSGTAGEDGSWPPPFWKIRIHLDDGNEVLMTNKRRFGRIRLRQNPLEEDPLKKLGFDPLLEMPTKTDFQKLMSRRTGVIKAVLLDQSLAAGVGNWLADEILFQAKVDPRRRVTTLNSLEIERIRSSMRGIVQKACSVNAERERFPRAWLFHRRWGRKKGTRTVDGDPIRHTFVAGRSTAWVPARQK